MLCKRCILLVFLFLDVDLYKFEDVSTESFHRLDQIISSLIHADEFRNLRRVDVVNLQKVVKNLPQI